MGRRYRNRKLAWLAGFQQSKRLKETDFNLNSEHEANRRLSRLHRFNWIRREYRNRSEKGNCMNQRAELESVQTFVPGHSTRTSLLLHGAGGNENDLIPLGHELDPDA